LAAWLNYSYTMIRWPIFAIPIAPAAMGHYRRIEEFTFAFGAALAATTILSALRPAIGVYQQIGLARPCSKTSIRALISTSYATCR
jgi:hypothetical protein